MEQKHTCIHSVKVSGLYDGMYDGIYHPLWLVHISFDFNPANGISIRKWYIDIRIERLGFSRE